MAQRAIVFPGQGSQAIGMQAELFEALATVRDTYAEASDALGVDLAALRASGPETSINATENTQPLLLTAGVAVWRAYTDAGGQAPAYVAGHSLGEYTALCCAGAIAFADAVRLVRDRGRFMQSAVPVGAGAMAVVLGLDDDAVREICDAATDGDDLVAAVNFNAPGQVAIAGTRAAVERATEAAKAAGARRAMLLPVSVPSHCALMRPAAEALAGPLAETELKAPSIPVVNNVDVALVSEPDAIRDALLRQLYNPVQWVASVEWLRDNGVTALAEFGPSKVLAGLVRRIDKTLQMDAIDSPAAIEALVAAPEA
ncbi:MAG: ACP S-malonyltransferase [Pseudomonadota bacterium]